MNKTVGILAHVDAGKTTFSEQVLFQTKSINKRGRVDKKTAFLDSHEIERERGITIFSDVGIISYKDSTYYLIDTPGHVDFSPEMERAIQVLDVAILIVSASEGIEGHTETVWQLLRKYQIPTFFFINKIDLDKSNLNGSILELRENFSKELFDLSLIAEDGKMTKELIEMIAERDEELLEMYVNGNDNEILWMNQLIKMIKENKLFPYASGSALQDIGVMSFFNKFDALTKTDYLMDEPFKGRIFKIRHDENGVKMFYLKAFSGELSVRDEVIYTVNNKEIKDKVTQIIKINGHKKIPVEKIVAGEVFAIKGLTEAVIGTGINCLSHTSFEIIPTLKSKVIYDKSYNTKDVLKAFQTLESEDPSLSVIWEEDLKEIDIHVMGTIQLEVLERIVKSRFNYDVSFDKPEILYLETIDKTVYGYGHYEPLRHYAEVHLQIEPGKRGSGIILESVCHPNVLPIGMQNTILHYLIGKKHRGILTGSHLTDLKISLLKGLNHNKHTSGGDFKEATLRALRQGLEKAENKLLEPFYDFKIKVDINLLGRVISDIEKASGSFKVPQVTEDKAVITGRVPVSTFMNYPTELASFTHGKGIINLTFSGYDACHNEEEVISLKNYNKESDLAYSSSSVFCAKGQSFVVKWDEAEKMMHGLK